MTTLVGSMIVFAAGALAGAGTDGSGILDLSVGAVENRDAPFIRDAHGVGVREHARFVDGEARLTYAFRTRGLHRLRFVLRLANNFRVLVSNDAKHWQQRLSAMQVFGCDQRDGKVREYRLDVSDLLPAEHVYLRFLDGSPLDGWGAYVAHIRLESDAPPGHHWRPVRADARKLEGGIRLWALLGPFAAGDAHALLASGRQAAGIDPATLYPPRNGRWREIRADADGRVDLLRLRPGLRPGEHAVVFVHAFLYSEKEVRGRLLLGSDDGIAVWWNGGLLLDHEVRRGCADAQEDVPVRLGKGWNRLLLEIANGEGDWRFSARLVDENGKRGIPVQVQASNPVPDADPFPTARPAPEIEILSAEPAIRDLQWGSDGVRLPLEVRIRNAGRIWDRPPAIEIVHEQAGRKGGTLLLAFPMQSVPAGTTRFSFPVSREFWRQLYDADGGRFAVRLGEREVGISLPPVPWLLAEAADRSGQATSGIPEFVRASLKVAAEAQRWWNAFDVDALEQKRFSLRILDAFLRADAAGVRDATDQLQKRSVPASWQTIVQCAAPWGEDFDVQSDAVLVYGLANTAGRTKMWRMHGYRAGLMTGIAWGGYQDYLYGRFDGRKHLDDAQTDRNGRRISHGGDVYYMVPTRSYTEYLKQFISQSFRLPLDGICLEEPEFWMRGGWSPAFRREWREFYGEEWQPPDSSWTACWRAAALRKELYRRCLAEVCGFVKQQRPDWTCTVATHSLFHYANIGIASPESALARIEGCTEVIAQVWTDTIVFPCRYEGRVGPFPFGMAWLEFAQMVGMITPTGMDLAFLADPSADDPNRSWKTCRTCWEHTVVAGLHCPQVTRFEVMPWPDRVFRGRRFADENAERRETIPRGYAVSLLAVTQALRTMPAGAAPDAAGAGVRGAVAVGVSDSLMFERGRVRGKSGNFDAIYGLTLPLIRRGFLPVLVQLEHLAAPVRAGVPEGVRVFLLSYNGQKPLSADVHAALAEWVRSGGVLVFFSDGSDPFGRIPEWWNRGGRTDALPREHLFRTLGLPRDFRPGTVRVGRGWFVYEDRNSAIFSEKGGGARLMKRLRTAARLAGMRLPSPRNWTSIRRGPYLAVSSWTEEWGEAFRRDGRFLDLFDDELRFTPVAACPAGRSGLWLDLEAVPDRPGVLCSASRITGWRVRGRSAVFVSRGPASMPCVTWVRLPRAPDSVTARLHNGSTVGVRWEWNDAAGALRLSYENRPGGVWVRLHW